MTDGTWLPAADLLDHLGVAEDSPAVASVERARLAAAAQVERARRDLLVVGEDDVETFTATPDIVEGALLLAARLHSRKGSPVGLASYSEFGPANVPRFDADIERLLGVGRYARPRVG